MKNLILKFTVGIAIVVGFGACSGSSDSKSDDSSPADIVLTHGNSVSCSDKSTFSVTPLEGNTPDVTFSTNTTSGVTTISYNSIDGSATVSGCQ